jgi:hypothetical protein
VTLEVLQVFVVVKRMIPNRVILLRRRVYDGGVLVCKARKVDPVFFRVQRFEVPVRKAQKISNWEEMEYG